MNKLGFCIGDLGKNQLAYELLCNLPIPNHDCIIFYEQITQVCAKPQCCTMNISESWGFDGALIATNMSTARKVLDYVCCNKKYFLVYDLEWIRLNNLLDANHDKFAEVYRHPDLELLCRSKDHQRIIKNCWNVDAKIFTWDNLENILCPNETLNTTKENISTTKEVLAT